MDKKKKITSPLSPIKKNEEEKDENGHGVPDPARVLVISSVCFEREQISEGSNNPADMRKFLNAL